MKVTEFLESFKSFIISNNYNVFDVAISSRENSPVLLKIQDIDYLPDSYSVAKSFAVCACGLLYDEGKLNLNEPITNVLKEFINYEYDNELNQFKTTNGQVENYEFEIKRINFEI